MQNCRLPCQRLAFKSLRLLCGKHDDKSLSSICQTPFLFFFEKMPGLQSAQVPLLSDDYMEVFWSFYCTVNGSCGDAHSS